MAKPVILIVDDERNTRAGLSRALGMDYTILLEENGLRGLETLRQRDDIDIVLTDLRMPEMDGMTFIKRTTALNDPPLVIMLTAYGSVQTAVEAMKVGAYDYVTKPVNLDNLEMIIRRGLETRQLRAENDRLRASLGQHAPLDGIIGRSRPMLDVLEVVRQIAPTRTTAMITGESGTGKELIAQAIHRLSPRNDKPFVAVHCAALNANLLESELFGHEKGAFTGAHERQIGRFEKADGGTLFLDEIGEIDASLQVKLLRVLETRAFERVGGSRSIETDVRLVAATNRDLKAMVDAGTFREDLYYRLNVARIHIPPLRDRTEDLEILLDHYRAIFARENGKDVSAFTPEAQKVLAAYAWPGNVRELRNCVERMVVMARGSRLSMNDVPPEIRTAVAEPSPASAPAESAPDAGNPAGAPEPGGLDLDANERALIIRALEECQGNRTHAAKMLGISRRTLHRKLNLFSIESH